MNTTRNYAKGMLALSVLAAASVGFAQDIRVTIDGDAVSMQDAHAVMLNDRVMVPVRGVFEHMNASVDWNPNSQIVTAKHRSTTISLPINSYTAMVNDRTVNLDSPAVIHNGRTMVPLRFISEALGADVKWDARARNVLITSDMMADNTGTTGVGTGNTGNTGGGNNSDLPMYMLSAGTVIPFTLDKALNSKTANVGDTFTAMIDTKNDAHYQDMPKGTVLEGRVDVARAKDGDTPGVLGLEFDRVRLPNGNVYPISGALIGLDSKSVENLNGRLTAKPGSRNDNLTYIGYGAGGGVLMAILTKGNILTSALIGGALGLLLGEIQKNPGQSREVDLAAGSPFGVRLTRDLEFRTRTQPLTPQVRS